MRVRVVRFYCRYVEMYLKLKSATKCRQKLSPAVAPSSYPKLTGDTVSPAHAQLDEVRYLKFVWL